MIACGNSLAWPDCLIHLSLDVIKARSSLVKQVWSNKTVPLVA